MSLFRPEDYLALPDCLEKETVGFAPGFDVDIDMSALKLNQDRLRSFFATFPPYAGWQDFLPFANGSTLLAKMYVLVGDRVGTWEMSPDFSIVRKSRIPKPSRGDIEEAAEEMPPAALSSVGD